MKKYIFILFLIISLFIINGIQYYKYHQYSRDYIIERLENKEKLNLYLKKNHDKFYNEKQNENLKLNGNTKLITIDRDTILLKNIFKKNKLVIRYKQSNCRVCINAELDVLSKNASLISDEICIIASYDKFRGVFTEKRKLLKKGLKDVEIYLLKEELNIPLEKQNTPYYFYTNSNLIVSNLFIPEKENPQLSNIYLKFFIKNYYVLNPTKN